MYFHTVPEKISGFGMCSRSHLEVSVALSLTSAPSDHTVLAVAGLIIFQLAGALAPKR